MVIVAREPDSWGGSIEGLSERNKRWGEQVHFRVPFLKKADIQSDLG